MTPCTCCTNNRRNSPPPEHTPAVARWWAPSGHVSRLCRNCLNLWFDNADDDPDLEPRAWHWLRT